jgi:tetratricopeptide (TPR) repeat protein
MTIMTGFLKLKNYMRSNRGIDYKSYNRWLFLGIVLLLSFSIYAPALEYEFVYDDFPLIVENDLIRDIRNIPAILTKEDKIDQEHTGYYRPLVPLFDLVYYYIFGLNPKGFHLANIMYHLGNVLLVFFLALRILRDVSGAFVASAFFGLHPVNTEAVIFLTGRFTLICAFFVIASCLLFHTYRDKPSFKMFILLVISFFLGIFSKEFAVMVPFVLISADLLSKRDLTKADFLAYVPFFVIILFYLVVRSFIVQGLIGIPVSSDEIWSRLFRVPDLLLSYLKLVFFPIGQKALYDIQYASLIRTIFSVIVLIAIVWGTFKRRSITWVSFSISWFFIFFLPVMDIIPLSGPKMAERWLYIPMIGAGVFLGGIYASLSRNKFRDIIYAAVLLVLAVLTILRSPVWKNEEALYSDMIITTPTSYKGYYNLGNVMYKKGNIEEAQKLWNKVIEIRPDMYAVHNNLGVLYEKTGRYDLSVHHYTAVLQVRAVPEVYINLGNALQRLERFAEAEDAYREAINLSKDNPAAYLHLSSVYEALNSQERAIAVLEEGIRVIPGDYRLYNRLGTIHGDRGQYNEAVRNFKEAYRLNPECYECRFNMEMIYRFIKK